LNLIDVSAWAVVWAFDQDLEPRRWKLWVAVTPAEGWFLRINTLPNMPESVLLTADRHPFLEHDSYLACGGDLIEVSDWELAEAMESQQHPERCGIVGVVAVEDRPPAIDAIRRSRRLTVRQRRIVLAVLAGG
jgi:hypothetical protein